MLNYWYKNAIFYNLDVETYQDSNNDGVGDFVGLTSRLDYLAGLGVTCLWLSPFYPTPNRDNGYDVADYFGIDSRLGSLGDFVDFIRAADERGIRVIIDLVVNHTSIDHPWFQSSRSSKASPYRDYYIWRKKKPEDAGEFLVFPGYQESTWTYDRARKEYYFHRFYEHQAELNIANPEVRNEIRKIMAFWLRMGVSGFRVDAVPFLIELKHMESSSVDSPYEYLTELRNYLSWIKGDAVLLAEANIGMEEVPEYFGDGDKLQMMFNFVLNQHVMYSLYKRDALAVREGLYKPPAIPENCQWANFLRNHDEFPVGRLSKSKQEELYEAWAPDEDMRIYNRGIRRRLPPMLDGDWNRLKLSHSLLMTLPGSPVLRYGEEIGMGEDLSLEERNSTRTPMQWSAERGGGFSTVDRSEMVRPVVNRGKFAYSKVNVSDQQRDADSLLSVTERMIRVRKENPAIGWGKWQIVETGQAEVLAHRCDWQGIAFIAVHNFSDHEAHLQLDLADLEDLEIKEILSNDQYEPPVNATDKLIVSGCGYRWFSVGSSPV